MKYWKTEKDQYGVTCSIDNLVFSYDLRITPSQAFDFWKTWFSTNIDGWNAEKSSRLDRTTSEWDPYNYAIWGAGIFVKIGNGDKKLRLLDRIRFEINPNKHFDEPVWTFLTEFIYAFCKDGYLERYDLACDFETIKENIVVRSRKAESVVKGTLYFGRRSRHGFLKIYDKKLESDLEDNLTRVEYTLVPDGAIPTDEIFVADFKLNPDESLGSNAQDVYRLLMVIQSLGGDFVGEYNRLGRKMRANLKPFIFGGTLTWTFPVIACERLLNAVCDGLDLVLNKTAVYPRLNRELKTIVFGGDDSEEVDDD